MFKCIRKSDAPIRTIADNKVARNYVTKDFSPNISLAVIEASEYRGEISTNHDRIYFVLDGTLTLEHDGECIVLEKEDACFINAGSTYTLSGTFRAVVDDSPAFGTPY